MKISYLFAGFMAVAIQGITSLALYGTSTATICGDFYEQATGKPPTRENLLASMAQQSTNGDRKGEIDFAIATLTERKDVPSDFVARLQSCLKANPFPRVQYRCAVSLLEFDFPSGLQLATQLLADENHPIVFKTHIASALERKGILSGYSILKTIVQSPTGINPRTIEGLIQQFNAHDGQPWNDKGDLVDMKTVQALWKEFLASLEKKLKKY